MKTYVYHLLAVALLLIGGTTLAQTTFRGILINARDSSVIPYAVIKHAATKQAALTDSMGAFSFTLPAKSKVLDFDVSVVGYKTTIHHKRTFGKTEKVYLEVGAYGLKEAEIFGTSAFDIVRAAVKAIPNNYANSSYFAYSSYRQYQRVNGGFMNLIEVQPVVMFKLDKNNKALTSDEAYASTQVRRTLWFDNPSNGMKDNLADLMRENPIYYLSNSSIAPGKLYSYTFNFDTTYNSPDYYVIDYYSSDFSSETHGSLDPIVHQTFFHEAYETGELIIDRETLAFAKIHRNSTRNPKYAYPYFCQLNFVYPRKQFFWEFVNAELTAEYNLINGKWYLSSLCRQYTDDYFNEGWGNKIYTISDMFEWRCDSISRYVGDDLVQQFYPKLREYGPYKYDKTLWDKLNFPFTFYPKEAVFKGLEHYGAIDEQFEKEGNKEME